MVLLALAADPRSVQSQRSAPAQIHSLQIHSLKVTVLSTMLAGDDAGIGEWGFAALVEADGKRILLDTGARPGTVLQNAAELKIDLSDVKEVVLTHNHPDHVGGLLTLQKEMAKKNPAALSIAHVSRGIFFSRPAPRGEANVMISVKKEFEAGGGRFIERDSGAEIFPGAWLSGPVPRKFPERNWGDRGKVQTPAGLVEDTIPEDQSLVLHTPQGMVLVTGCGHAGVINILTFVHDQFPNEPVLAIVGGLHLYAASDEQLEWTAGKLKEFKVANILGAHCTGIEAVYRIRELLGLKRQSAVVGTVASTFVLGEGIHTGTLAS
jgi:7,8-dihydropterin-6-yl-methyl-4-(beta-D-ribofuranosyl)aminobenzene 5'-phosphate synthase